MASGKKNYFRHSFNARNDEFIIELINTFKEKGYFMWFALVEMSAEMLADGHQQPLKFNRSRLIRELRCNESTLKVFLTYCEGRSKVLHTYLEPTFNIEIPNLLKYVGKYSENSPNKRKENKRKEKETKGDFIASNFFSSKDECELDEKILPEKEPLNFRNPKDSVLSGLMSGHACEVEICKWLCLGEESVQKVLLETYDPTYLREVIAESYFWQKENKKRKAGRFIKEWINRDNKRVYAGGLNAGDKLMHDFMKESGAFSIEKGA